MLAPRRWLNLNQPPCESMCDRNRPGDKNMLQFKMNDKFERKIRIYIPNLQMIHINVDMLFPVQVLFPGMNVVGIEAGEDVNKKPGDLFRAYS